MTRHVTMVRIDVATKTLDNVHLHIKYQYCSSSSLAKISTKWGTDREPQKLEEI